MEWAGQGPLVTHNHKIKMVDAAFAMAGLSSNTVNNMMMFDFVHNYEELGRSDKPQ